MARQVKKSGLYITTFLDKKIKKFYLKKKGEIRGFDLIEKMKMIDSLVQTYSMTNWQYSFIYQVQNKLESYHHSHVRLIGSIW